MLPSLLIITTLIACRYAYKRTVRQGLVEIDHVGSFTFGFLFYWILPVVIGTYAARLSSRLSVVFSSLFDKRYITPYAAACLGLYLCFVAGDSLGLRLFGRGPKAVDSSSRPKIPRLTFSFVTAIGCVLAVYTWFELRDQLLLPYGTRLTFNPARGTLTSSILLIGVAALMFTIDRPELAWKRRLASLYFIAFSAGALVLISLGSRLYVSSFFLMFVIYQSSFRKPLRKQTVIAGALAFVFLLGALGIWRSNEELAEAAPNVLREPLMTSLSLVHHLRYQKIAWMNYPVYLTSDFANLIPALIVPTKASLLKRPPIFNPLGGLHSFVSFDLNFGVVGTGIFWFLLPVFLRYLRSRATSTLFATMYVMCSGWMAFTFFRDPFFVSLIKAILQDAILMPAIIVAFGALLSHACVGGSPVTPAEAT